MEIAGTFLDGLQTALVVEGLDPPALRAAATASRGLRRVCLDDDALWRRQFARRFERDFTGAGSAATAYAARLRVVNRFRKEPEGTAVLTGHRSTVRALAVSPDDEDRLYSASSDGLVKCWDLRSGRCCYSVSLGRQRAYSVATLGDHVLSGAENGAVYISDAAGGGEGEGEAVASRPVHGTAVRALATHAASASVVSGDATGRVSAWSLDAPDAGEVALHRDVVSALSVSPEGLVLSSSRDGTLKLFPLELLAAAPDAATVFGHPAAVLGCAAGPRGLLATACRDDSVRLWDPRSGPVHTFGTPDAALCVEFSPRGHADVLFSGSWDNAVTCYDLRQLAPLYRYHKHRGPVRCVRCTDSRLLSGSWDMSVHVSAPMTTIN